MTITAWSPHGLETARGDPLDRPVATAMVLVPSHVEQQGDRLCWGSTPDQPPAPRQVGRQGLETFIRLAGAADGGIVAYARRHGVLHLCAHGLPCTHNPARHAATSMAMADQMQGPARRLQRGARRYLAMRLADGCQPETINVRGRLLACEPLHEWRLWGCRFRAALNIASSLHGDRPGSVDDWQDLLRGGTREVPWWTRTVRAERLMLMGILNTWLRIGDVRPTFQWRVDEGPSVFFSGGSVYDATLFATLVCQVVFACARSEGVAVCSTCGTTYTPNRRPRVDQRSYCPRCRLAGAPQRDAQRARRRRKAV